MSNMSRVNTAGATRVSSSVLASVLGTGAASAPEGIGTGSVKRVAPAVSNKTAGESATLTA